MSNSPDADDLREIVAVCGSYELVWLRGEYRIEDVCDGAISSPLDSLFAAAIIARPENMLDMQLQCPTPRAPYVARTVSPEMN